MATGHTKLYSRYPTRCTVERASQIKTQIQVKLRKGLQQRLNNGVDPEPTPLMERDLFPPLPWTMKELPGTTWRNAHTFEQITVEEIAENERGQLGPDPDPWINIMFSIGLWWNERFVIGHWVRTDHLNAAEQMKWHLARTRRQIAEYHQALEHKREKTTCIREETKERAITAARRFATSHGLAFDINALNQLTMQATQRAQLTLF